MSGRVADAPVLEGRHVLLRTVIPDDHPALLAAESSGDLIPRWRFRGATPQARRPSPDTLLELLVVERATGHRVGLVAVYEADLADGHARLAAARLDQTARSPLMMLGLAMAVNYVFGCWALRKLYLDLPEYNLEQFASGMGRHFELEARLRDHLFYGGERWDQLVLAIHRDAWERRPHPLLALELGS